MARNKIKMNNIEIVQPDEGLGYDFETTYSEDTTRTFSGGLYMTPLFTVEAFSYKASKVTAAQAKTILQIVATGGKFTMFYYSVYYGAWRTDTFYVGKGSLSVGQIDNNTGLVDEISFNIIGVNPL